VENFKIEVLLHYAGRFLVYDFSYRYFV